MILCLRPLPAANGGWNSAKWRTPKLAAPVSVRPVPLTEWLTALPPPARADLQAILTAPFVAALRLEAPATDFETAVAYAGVVAEACAGVVILGDELTADRRASVSVWSGPQIEERWRAIDAEAARAEPGYQPVRDLNDDHRPTQSFAFPIVIDGIEITTPTSRAVYEAALSAMAAPEPTTGNAATTASHPAVLATVPAATALSRTGVAAVIPPTAAAVTEPIGASFLSAEEAPAERRAAGSAPPPPSSGSERRITVSIPPLHAPSHEPAAGSASTSGLQPASSPLDGADNEKTYDTTTGNEDDWSDVMPQ